MNAPGNRVSPSPADPRRLPMRWCVRCQRNRRVRVRKCASCGTVLVWVRSQTGTFSRLVCQAAGLLASKGAAHDRLPPPLPTAFLPGTPEKLAVMIARVEEGYSAFHPCDAGVGWLSQKFQMLAAMAEAMRQVGEEIEAGAA